MVSLLMLPVSASEIASETFIIEDPSFKRFLIITHITIPFPITINNPRITQTAANIPAPVMLHSSHSFKVTLRQKVEAWLEQKAGIPQTLDLVRLMYAILLLVFAVIESEATLVPELIAAAFSENSSRSSNVSRKFPYVFGLRTFFVTFDSHVVVAGLLSNECVKLFALDSNTACVVSNSLWLNVLIFNLSPTWDSIWSTSWCMTNSFLIKVVRLWNKIFNALASSEIIIEKKLL